MRYAKSFERDLDAIKHDSQAKERLSRTINDLRKADSTREIRGIKSITGFQGYHRIRIGDYRLGLKVVGNVVELLRFLHRRDIYRRFP